MDLILKQPNALEFKQICDYINEFELDNRALQKDEFIGAYRNDELVGFGRIRKHKDCNELCSLGVITNERRKGIGKALSNALIKKESNNLYLVCIIPDFFKPLGFIETCNYPISIQDKIDYCSNELVVPEKYVAMKFKKD
jgi:N-acetylglutamate synthase-like GNAT family acetyltransferase